MKTVAGLVVIVVLVLVTVVGCDSTPSEQVYQDVLVGSMTARIPDDWERPEGFEEYVEDFYTYISDEDRQAIQINGYSDESEEVALVFITKDMVESTDTWRGWDIELEEMNMSADEYALMLQSGFLLGLEELNREKHHRLTIGGNEASETIYTGISQGESSKVCVLVVFAECDVGLVMFGGKEADVEEFEGIWETVRDSVEFQN
jgi:hypothetical protein